MKSIEKIKACDNKTFIEILEEAEGVFSLRKFINRYDVEEEVEYTIRQKPDPSGKYGDLKTAKKEARRLLMMPSVE